MKISDFWKNVAVGGMDACWPWLRAVTSAGYGSVFIDGRRQSAHRVAYALVHGPIPDSLVIDHKCRNKVCVNPRHLDLVTTRVNVIDRSQSPVAQNARKTHCRLGHPFNTENTYVDSTGRRHCRTCMKANDHKHRTGQFPADPAAWVPSKARGGKLSTQCRRGHALTPDNTWVSKTGVRRCRTCLRINGTARRRRLGIPER